MKKRIIRIIAWIAIIFAALTIAAAVVLYLNRDKIQRVVINEVNKVLAIPIQVKSVSISLRKFPSASLLLTDVYCRGANSHKGDTLLYSHELFFEFSLWNVFSKDIKIEHISLNNGLVNITIPAQGNPNYKIWKEDTNSTSQNGVFTLDKVSFDNFALYIYHQNSEFYASADVHHFDFSGDFATANFILQNEGQFQLDSLKVGDQKYLHDVAVNTSFELKGDGTNTYINGGNAHLDDITLTFAIDILPEEVHVIADGNQLPLDEVQSLVENQKLADIGKIDLSGKGNVHFDGIFKDNEEPGIAVTFSTGNASIKGLKNSRLSNVSCQGSYHLNKDHDRIHLSSFSGEGKTGNFKGALDIDDLSNPGIVLDLESDLELREWLIFLPLDTIDDPSGRARIKLHFENRFKSLKDIKPEELKRAHAEGDIQLENIGFRFKKSDRTISHVNAELAFAGNDLKIKNFYFKTGESDIYLKGTFANVLNFIYFDNEKLRVDASAKSQQLKMEDFLISGTSNNDRYSLHFAHSLDLELNLSVDQFYFDKFHATNIKGQLNVKNGIIDANSISLNADEGSFKANFNIDMRPKTHYDLSAGLYANGVNLHDLFVSFKNFGQDAILAENIYGKADANMQMTAVMDTNLSIDPASVNMTSELSVENGNLKNYEPMLALSRFAEIDELKNVQFTKLHNQISIHNSKIIIPEMEVNSNVLNMGIQGTHSFDNQINYVIRMKLGDVLFSKKKHKVKKSEFDEHLVEVENSDDPNIYVKMTGSAYNPVISLDKKSIGKSIKEDLHDQGKELQSILKNKKKDHSKENSGIKYDLFGDDAKKDH